MLEPLFMLNGCFNVVCLIKPDQSIDVVLGSETWRYFLAMLIHPPNEVVGHANVQSAMALTRHDVDKISHALRLWLM